MRALRDRMKRIADNGKVGFVRFERHAVYGHEFHLAAADRDLIDVFPVAVFHADDGIGNFHGFQQNFLFLSGQIAFAGYIDAGRNLTDIQPVGDVVLSVDQIVVLDRRCIPRIVCAEKNARAGSARFHLHAEPDPENGESARAELNFLGADPFCPVPDGQIRSHQTGRKSRLRRGTCAGLIPDGHLPVVIRFRRERRGVRGIRNAKTHVTLDLAAVPQDVVLRSKQNLICRLPCAGPAAVHAPAENRPRRVDIQRMHQAVDPQIFCFHFKFCHNSPFLTYLSDLPACPCRRTWS